MEINSDVRIDDNEISFSFARSGGPGGQNVNKLNTKAVLHWCVETSTALRPAVKSRFRARYGNRINDEGEVVISSGRYRTQAQNKKDCLDRLEEMILAVLVPPKKRRATRPTRGSKERRLSGKRQLSQKKQGRKRVTRDD